MCNQHVTSIGLIIEIYACITIVWLRNFYIVGIDLVFMFMVLLKTSHLTDTCSCSFPCKDKYHFIRVINNVVNLYALRLAAHYHLQHKRPVRNNSSE